MNVSPEVRNIYLISGLGADWRLYRNLVFPQNTLAVHIAWITPHKHENMREYAKRLCEKIDTTVPFYLIGLSFGGMVAVEMNNFITPVKTIIISSAKTCAEIPWYYKLAGKCHLPQIAPIRLVKFTHPLVYWFFGMKTKDEKILLKQVFKEMDGWFIRWATTKVSCWKNTQVPDNLIHIHGTNDKVLPHKFARPHKSVPGGEHLMIYTLGEEISKLIALETGTGL